MNEQRIGVVTDTGTDTPADFCARHDVRVVPLRVNYSDGTTYESGVDITTAQIVRRFEQEVPKTSLPSPERIADAFEQARADGYAAALFVSISSGLSATCETARMVARTMEGFPVTVVDTRSIGVAAGLVVMEAVRQIEAGVPFAALPSMLDITARNTSFFFAVRSLDYLRAVGRISEAAYRLGSVLNIKPVFTCDEDGHYAVRKKARGWGRALDAEVALIEELARKYPKVRLAISCTEACADAYADLEAKLRRQVDNAVEIVRSDISPALLVHTGPDLIGLAVQGL